MKLFVTILTIARLPLILGAVILNLLCDVRGSVSLFFLSASILVLCGVTDYLDGYLARKYHVESNFGAHADPMMDKLFFAGILPLLIFLTATQGYDTHALVLTLVTISFVFRDQLVTFLRMIGEKHNISGRASLWGKLRTATAFPALLIIYYSVMVPPKFAPPVPLIWLYFIEVYLIAITVITLVLYLKRYMPAIQKELA
jgi:CDP-diacylglycerol--glycerol-3-phosphate 3-phosphatidyltransferase